MGEQANVPGTVRASERSSVDSNEDSGAGAEIGVIEDHSCSIAIYRSAHVLPDGPFPQVQGLLDADVARALADPRTVVAPIIDANGDVVPVPVFTPIDLAPWYSPEYRRARFRRELTAGYDIWHLSTFPSIPDEIFADLLDLAVPSLLATSPRGCVVFADHADRPDDPSGDRLDRTMHATGRFEEVAVRGSGPAREHYFAGRVERHGTPQNVSAIDLRTQIGGPTYDQRFLVDLWSIYEVPFRSLAAQTPLRTYFEFDELAEAVSQPGVIQVQHRVNDRIVSWMMMTNRVGSFPWMDADAFRRLDPDLDDDAIWVFPGVVTDETYRGQHCVERLIDGIAFAMCSRGPRHLVVFETLDENVSFLPDLITRAVNATGFVTIRFEEVGAQVHRAWRTIS